MPRRRDCAEVIGAALLAKGQGDGLVVDDRGHAFTWPASPATWERRACAIAGRNLTRQEWAQFIPGQNYTNACP